MLTRAEFNFINTNDYQFHIDDLRPAQRRMVKRMKMKGIVSKRASDVGMVRITQNGQNAWWNHPLNKDRADR